MNAEGGARLVLAVLLVMLGPGCKSAVVHEDAALHGLDDVSYFYCNGRAASVAWVEGHAVEIAIDGKRYAMNRVVAESGARYESAADKIALVVEGTRATMTIDDRPCGQYYPPIRQADAVVESAPRP